VPRRDQRKLEEQREVTRLLDNLMHRRPRQFAPRFPRNGLHVHSLESFEHLDAPSPRRTRGDRGSSR